jgi:hypothetical protein
MSNKKNLPDWAVEQLQEQEFLRQQNSVTRDDYKKAIERLVKVAIGDTSAAAVAAQVLLSIYNGQNWQLDITDLGSLDGKNIQAAFIAMRGWLFVAEYPHNVIDDGPAIFDRLEKQWQRLHATNRYARFYNGES